MLVVTAKRSYRGNPVVLVIEDGSNQVEAGLNVTVTTNLGHISTGPVLFVIANRQDDDWLLETNWKDVKLKLLRKMPNMLRLYAVEKHNL